MSKVKFQDVIYVKDSKCYMMLIVLRVTYLGFEFSVKNIYIFEEKKKCKLCLKIYDWNSKHQYSPRKITHCKNVYDLDKMV